MTRGPVGASWRTVGKVAVDETNVHHVNIKVGGFVDTVYVDYVGKPVQRGERLFSIYSPDLLSVQQEYLLALRTRKAPSPKGASLPAPATTWSSRPASGSGSGTSRRARCGGSRRPASRRRTSPSTRP